MENDVSEVASVLLNFVNKSSVIISKLVSEIHSALTSVDLLEGDVTSLRSALTNCQSQLLNVTSSADRLVSQVRVYVKYANITDDHKGKIYESVKKGDCTLLNKYLHQLSCYFMQCQECYKRLRAHHQSAIIACSEGEEDCKRRIDKVKRAGKTMVVVGTAGGVAGITAATVLGASVVAGVFTMGIGAPIVLGIGSVVGGAVTSAVGGAMVATDSQNEQLNNISKKFTNMKDFALDLDMILFKVLEKMRCLKMDKEIVYVVANELQMISKSCPPNAHPSSTTALIACDILVLSQLL